MMIQIFQDALFSAIAAIGFAAISNPPARAYIYCAVIAAVGHAGRFLLTTALPEPLHIVPATLCAAFVVGLLAVFLSPLSRTPAETCLFPALLPMIPGIYAYKAFGGLAMCVLRQSEGAFDHYFPLFMQNGLMCMSLLLCLVIGGTIPIFIFKKVSFQATR
ncbi:MAG: threonine/serine exporter family protein [Bacteroides sp.]|nr:threonine/serine exporter family protein [Lachnospiraceae bacterium]MCM1331822.1 threonine/serine exporter family protein [Bacteroides sp.]MCM1390725.1 threonine/serine exporter family protein [Bacteroides sp.]